MGIVDYLATAKAVLDATMRHPGTRKVDHAVDAVVTSLRSGAPLLVCGNGGSATDAMHITGELVGRFLKERRALNCICLSSHPAVLTAWPNDHAFETVFSRQVEAHGKPGGAMIGISTSGNSENVVKAFAVARTMGICTIALTGEDGGKLSLHADILIDVPSRSTPLIQQVHVCLYHYLCEQVEAKMIECGS